MEPLGNQNNIQNSCRFWEWLEEDKQQKSSMNINIDAENAKQNVWLKPRQRKTSNESRNPLPKQGRQTHNHQNPNRKTQPWTLNPA